MRKNLPGKGIKYITSAGYRFLIDAGLGRYDNLPDEKYLKRKYQVLMGRELNLDAPKTFNEKLQWLKLYDRKPEYTVMTDKLAVREHIAQKLGTQHMVPLLGVWDDPDDIDFDALPEQFVLKCNHNSGLGMYICKDRTALNIKKVRKELRKGLRQDYYLTGREWSYKDIPRKIICEKFMTDGGRELADFKVHNFNGEPRLILVCQNRFGQTGLTEDFFSTEWEHLPIKRPDIPNASQPIPKPEQLERMLELARILSKGIPFVRTDFYISDGQVFFGELTFYPASGMSAFEPESWDETLGSWLTLPEQRVCAVEPKRAASKLKRILAAAGKYIESEDYRFLLRAWWGFYDYLPDEEYLKRRFRVAVQTDLNLEEPKTFSEKLQWLKLYNRQSEYTVMVDKVAVREHVAQIIGGEYLIPLLGVWDDPDDIDFDALPDQFVLKCNHNSGLGMYICKDRSKLNIEKVKKDLRKGLKQDYYLTGREWVYKDVPRKILAEVFLTAGSDEEIKDYKFFCFGGEPLYCQVISDRSTGETIDFFDMQWNHMDFTGLSAPGKPYPFSRRGVTKPIAFEQMKDVARKLSQGIPFVRIDMYEVKGKVYFGEITFFPASGFGVFEPPQWNGILGDRIRLPKKNEF